MGLPVAPEDNYQRAREFSRRLAANAGEWCGIPVPITGQDLVLEKNHPAAAAFNRQSVAESDRWINRWYSWSKRVVVVVGKDEEGLIGHDFLPAVHSIGVAFDTMACSIAWSIEAEEKAQAMLRTLIKEHLFKTYLLTGMFPETSKRSGVSYLFRRLRPTVALRPHPKQNDMRILCCLCLHPIGYYAGSWAGMMCPTDDVIAHLLLMRGDEHMFWKRANQISPERPEAGL